MGAGMRLSGPNGHLVVDVGAGKTEVAVLAMEGTIAGRCLGGHGGEGLATGSFQFANASRSITVPDLIIWSISRVAEISPNGLRFKIRRSARLPGSIVPASLLLRHASTGQIVAD